MNNTNLAVVKDGAARAEPTAHCVLWPFDPVDENEREAWNFDIRATRRMLDTEPQGAVVVRDNPHDRGPEALPLALRERVVDRCSIIYLIVGSEPLLPVEEIERDDHWLASSQTELQRPGRWVAFVHCTPASARRWLAYIRHREPDGEGAWVAQVGRGIIKEGAKAGKVQR